FLENNLFKAKLLASISNHPHIVKFIGLCNKKNSIAVVTEFCKKGNSKILVLNTKKGSLDKFIIKEREKFSFDQKLDTLNRIASGMLHLHLNNIIHRYFLLFYLISIYRDLKVENVLMDAGNQPKISDFGFSKIKESAKQSNNMTSG